MNHELYHGLNVFHLFGFLNTQMFSTGLKLMVVGMLMVLLFLLLMMLFIMLIEFLNRSHTKMEAQRTQQERKAQKQNAFQEPTIPAAVLAAAVSAYEAERQKLFIT
tara:strand:+ start:242 stop:559 length:318 start_codon:yes stop_codon:yes gene_type:complete